MATYTVRIWNNGENTTEVGSLGEYEMATEKRDLGGVMDTVQTPEQVQLRLLEALNCNLASIAQSLERLAQIQGGAHFGY